MIEKKIHYCWFGGNEKSELIKMCIASWKKQCPEYEIVEWNENNFDVNLCEYTAEAYKQKRWAFLSDVARLWIIYNYGGIYLDTDVEILKPLDNLLQYDAWFAFDDIKGINTGTGFGASKNNDLIRKVLDDYLVSGYDEVSCVTRNTKVIFDNISKLQYSYENQLIDGIFFISSTNIGKILKHYYTYTYGTKQDREQHRKKFNSIFKGIKWKIKVFLRNPRIIQWAEQHENSIIAKMYIFFVYDFIDYGISHYIKLIAKKLDK